MNPNIRSRQVPQNIMSVEFKLFDFMTLKQFVVLCVSGGLGFLFFALLGGIFKFLIPFIIILAGIIVAFAKYNGEPFAVFVTYFILAVLSPQKRVWKKKFTKSISSINDIGLLLPRTDLAKRADSYNSLILTNKTDMPQAVKPTDDIQNIVHETKPTTSSMAIPSEPIVQVLSEVKSQNLLDETLIPTYIKTESVNSLPIVNTNIIKEEPAKDNAKELVIKVEDANGTPLDSQVVLIETLMGVPIEAKVTVSGFARFYIPKRDNDYFIAVAANNNLEFDRIRLTYSQILTPVVHVIRSKEVETAARIAEEVQKEDSEVIPQYQPQPVEVQEQPILKATNFSNINYLQEAQEITSIDKNIPNTINGIVKDNEGHYLSGLIVAIKNEDKMIVRALSTNQLGQFFSHSPINSGTYTIEFEKEGFQFETYTVVITNQVITPRVYIGNKITVAENNLDTSGII